VVRQADLPPSQIPPHTPQPHKTAKKDELHRPGIEPGASRIDL
jgi:hypothetical protein